VGRALGADWLREGLVYNSPYRRTRETLDEICAGAGLAGRDDEALRVYEDPRLREVEHGYGDYDAQTAARRVHGWFYYRFEGGESPADCFDRTSGFIDSLTRQVERKQVERVLVVTHGLTIRCFVMRFLHLSVEAFEDLANPDNCAVITLGLKSLVENPSHVTGRWAASGLFSRSSD
jgi:broad specificity phosphatase PhoE